MINKKKDIISILFVIVCSVLIIFSSRFIYDKGFVKDRLNKGLNYYEVKILDVSKEMLKQDTYIDSVELGYQDVKVEFLEGPYKGKQFNIKNNISRVYNIKVKKDMKVIAGVYEKDGQLNDISIYSYKRDKVIYILTAIFFLVIILVGKLKGLKAIVSLVFTCISVLYLMIPMMFKGVEPIVAAIIIAIITTTVTMLLVSGRNKKTIAAIVGTIFGVTAAGLIAFLTGKFAHLSGITMDNAENIMYVAENSKLKVNGIMFAAILVAALGAVMDVAMSISSAVFEIHGVNSKLSKKDLFNNGMNIGKDIIGTMSNTLILAFAGSSLNILILLTAANMPYIQLINLDLLGTEIIQGLSGSIGIILTVPITAILSAHLCEKTL